VQQGHRLAGAWAAGHLSRAGVTGLVGDVALARVQKRAPRRERVSEDEPQLLLPGHEGDLVAYVGEQPLARWFGGGSQVLDGFLVADFQDSERSVDAEPATSSVVVRLVLREDCDQAIRVPVRVCGRPGGGGEDDATPVAVHRHEADPVVPAVPGLLQVLARVRVPGERGDGRVDGPLHVLVQLGVLAQEAFRDRQACHRLTSSPCQLYASWLCPKGAC
jgi:hypothetical protein